VASLPSPSEQPVTGVSAGFFPCGRLLVLTGQPAGGERRSKQPTGSAKLYPSRLTTLAFTVLELRVCGREELDGWPRRKRRP
jgi:hypothetical protein